jgi:hypothetical protein
MAGENVEHVLEFEKGCGGGKGQWGWDGNGESVLGLGSRVNPQQISTLFRIASYWLTA